MNLYFRMLRIFWFSWLAKKAPVFAKTVITLRAWPLDCDINLHLTNSRYFAFMDLGRTDYVCRQKMLRKLLRRKWLPVVAASEVTFIRPIKPLQKFKLSTELLCWDEKYQYFYQRFYSADTTFATALVKTAAYNNGKAVKSDKIVALSQMGLTSPEIPTSIAAFRQLSSTKRRVHG